LIVKIQITDTPQRVRQAILYVTKTLDSKKIDPTKDRLIVISHDTPRLITSRIWCIPSVRLLRNTFEWRSPILDFHEVPGTLVTLLVVAIWTLKLRTRRHSATPKIVASILRHVRDPSENVDSQNKQEH